MLLSLWHRLQCRFDAYRDYLCVANARPSRLLNAAKYLRNRGRSASLPYHPPFYMIDPGNVCRLRCAFCSQGHRDNAVHSSPAIMHLEEFTRILEQISPYALIVDLFKHGEPFLNPDIVEMIRAATKKGVRCRINSGMNFSLDSSLAREICESGLSRINCAIDGTTQDVYQQYRVNGDLSLVLRNASMLLKARGELGRGHPLMVYRMLVFEWNHHQVESARQLAMDMGFDRFNADPGMFIPDGGRTVQWDIDAARWRDTPWNLETIYPSTINPVPPPDQPIHRCPSLFNTMVIHATGASMVCCHSSRRTWEQESLLSHTLAEVWNSDQYVATRQAALGVVPRSDALFPQCRTCCWL